MGNPIIEFGAEEQVKITKLTAKALEETREYIPVLQDRKEINL